jgi:hypothetical protein
MCIADDLDKDVAIIWENNEKCPANFNDLFSNNLCRELNKNNALLIKTAKLFPDYKSYIERKQLKPMTRDQYPEFHSKDIFLKHFDKLKPVPYIQDSVETFAEQFSEDTISMSIRMWDANSYRRSMFSLDRIHRAIEKEDKRIFVGSDNQELVVDLKKKYGDKIIARPKSNFQDVIVEMLLLSRNDVLYGSFYSTFTEVAWWLGGGKQEYRELCSEKDIEEFLKLRPKRVKDFISSLESTDK